MKLEIEQEKAKENKAAEKKEPFVTIHYLKTKREKNSTCHQNNCSIC
jgi:hypothetical protein